MACSRGTTTRLRWLCGAWTLAAACGAGAEEEAPRIEALAGPRPAICDAPWFRPGARAQLEAGGDMPMSITMTIRHPAPAEGGCTAWIDIHSKSALAAMMGPPVVMDQVHKLAFIEETGSSGGRVDSQHAMVNAQARYARLFGEASFEGKGMLNYAAKQIREGVTLPGESFESSANLTIHSLATDEPVTTIRVPRASVAISARHVGREQAIETAQGRMQCLPIHYERRTTLGPLFIGNDVEQTETDVMEVTDWFCPSTAFVMRTDVRQKGKTEHIDTTSLGIDDGGL